jgi:hypothetical protein
MAKFDLLTTLSLNAAGYTQGIDRARKSTQDLQNTVQTVGKTITGALSFAGIGLSFAGVVKILKDGLTSTGDGADILEKATMKVNAAVQTLGRSIIEGKLTTLANDIKNAMKAAGEYADEMDKLNSQTLDLTVRKSNLDAQIKGLKALQAEGKLTKEQTIELARLNKELYETEIRIIKAKVDATIKMGADTRGINKEVFADLEKGVIERSKLSDKELNKVREFTQKYIKYEEQIRKANTTGVPFPVAGQKGLAVDMVKVNEKLEEFINTASDVERVQLFEDLFSSEPQWQALIGYFNELNYEMSDFNRNQGKIASKGAAVKDVMSLKEMGISKATTGLGSLGKLGGAGSKSKIEIQPFTSGIQTPNELMKMDTDEMMKQVKAAEELERIKESNLKKDELSLQKSYLITDAVIGIGNAFEGMFAGVEGSWKDMFTSIFQGIKQLIDGLLAAAIAGMIAGESKKGLLGLLTASIGIGALIGLWKSKVPAFANGGVSMGGMALVGERGPELVNLPRGSEVFSNSQSSNMFGGGEVLVRFQNGSLEGYLNYNNRRNNSFR